MQELISLIKSSHAPVICICNEHQSSKMRSLANHCYLLSFSHPKVEQIRGAIMSVCFKEGLKIDPLTLSEMIVASGQDLRQVGGPCCGCCLVKKQQQQQISNESHSSCYPGIYLENTVGEGTHTYRYTYKCTYYLSIGNIPFGGGGGVGG